MKKSSLIISMLILVIAAVVLILRNWAPTGGAPDIVSSPRAGTETAERVRRSARDKSNEQHGRIPTAVADEAGAPRVILSFTAENGAPIEVRRVVARNSGGLSKWFQTDRAAASWTARLPSGEWELNVQLNALVWIRRHLRVEGPTERTFVLPIPRRSIRLFVVDDLGRPVRTKCRLRLREASEPVRGEEGWNAMASWANAWPAGRMTAARNGLDQRFDGPETELSVQCGRRYIIAVESANGLRGRMWFRIASAGEDARRLELVLRRERERTFRVIEPRQLDDGLALILLSGGDWTRAAWKRPIDPRGETRIAGFRPFIGNNRAWLVSARTPGLPLGVSALPDAATEAWQSGDPVLLRFSETAKESWTWTGQPARGARLSFRVLHRKDDGRRFRVGAALGEIPWASAMDLPAWLSSDENWTVSLLRSSGDKESVGIDRAARRFSVATRTLRVLCVDQHDRPVGGAEVRFRPATIAPSPGAAALASWRTDSKGECTVRRGIEGGVIEVRHPSYEAREAEAPSDPEGHLLKITLEPLSLARMTVRWSDASRLSLTGDIQFTPAANRAHVATHGPGRASLSKGEALVPLDGGPGPHRLRIALEDEGLEFSNIVALDAPGVDIILAPPVASEVPVTGLGGLQGNLVIVVKYQTRGGWRVRSAANVRAGLAHPLVPRDPNTRLTVEVRRRRSSTSLTDLMFSSLLHRRRMTVSELLQGLSLESLSPGAIIVATSSKRATLVLRSRVSSSLHRIPANSRQSVGLPWGEGPWEATVNESLPFDIQRGDVVHLVDFAAPDRIRLGTSLAGLIEPKDATLTLSFRFFESVRIDLGDTALPAVKGNHVLRGRVRSATSKESLPVTVRRVGRVLELAAQPDEDGR